MTVSVHVLTCNLSPLDVLPTGSQRIMGVLSVEVPSGSATGRRKGAAAPIKTSIPITMAGPGQGPDSWEVEDAAAVEAAGSSSGVLRELDPEAAAMWKKFLAGSRAMDVPMWDNRMVDELPKVGAGHRCEGAMGRLVKVKTRV
jgi:hypothetical protein